MSELALNDQPRTIDCISLHQPWASWVAWGWKPIETRIHERFRSLAGKRIAIHAAQKLDEQAFYSAMRYLSNQQNCAAAKCSYPRGAILCTAFVSDFRRLTPADAPGALIECATPRFGLILEDLRLLARPVPFSGSQGIFRAPRVLIESALPATVKI